MKNTTNTPSPENMTRLMEPSDRLQWVHYPTSEHGYTHKSHRPYKNIEATLAAYGVDEGFLSQRIWPEASVGAALKTTLASRRSLMRFCSGEDPIRQALDLALLEKYREGDFKLRRYCSREFPWTVGVPKKYSPSFTKGRMYFKSADEAAEWIEEQLAAVKSGKLRSWDRHLAEEKEQAQKREEKALSMPVAQRIALLNQSAQLVGLGHLHSLIVSGPGGLGKSYTVGEALAQAGMTEGVDYLRVKGYSTPRGLYETLCKNNGKLLVLDDCDAALLDKTAVEILKSALDSNERRQVSWLVKNTSVDDAIPDSFEFTGKVIFITNRLFHQLDQALRTRCLVIDLQMTRPEILQRMRDVAATLSDFTQEQKIRVLAFIEAHMPQIKNPSLRTMLMALKLCKSAPNNWEALATYTVTQG